MAWITKPSATTKIERRDDRTVTVDPLRHAQPGAPWHGSVLS
jgi:hypothetical protein